MTGVFQPELHVSHSLTGRVLNHNRLSLTVQAASGDLFNIGSNRQLNLDSSEPAAFQGPLFVGRNTFARACSLRVERPVFPDLPDHRAVQTGIPHGDNEPDEHAQRDRSELNGASRSGRKYGRSGLRCRHGCARSTIGSVGHPLEFLNSALQQPASRASVAMWRAIGNEWPPNRPSNYSRPTVLKATGPGRSLSGWPYARNITGQPPTHTPNGWRVTRSLGGRHMYQPTKPTMLCPEAGRFHGDRVSTAYLPATLRNAACLCVPLPTLASTPDSPLSRGIASAQSLPGRASH
jgi:hypothetical protein